MKKTIITGSIIAFAIVGAGIWYLTKTPPASLVESGSPAHYEFDKKVTESGNFDLQFQNADGTVDKVKVSTYLDQQIAVAETDAAKLGRGTPEREKAERRVRMLKLARDRL